MALPGARQDHPRERFVCQDCVGARCVSEGKKIYNDDHSFCFLYTLGFRTNAASTDLTTVLPEEMAKEVKDAAQISMGTEVSEEDINNITDLCTQVISIAEYRDQLYDYLKNR